MVNNIRWVVREVFPAMVCETDDRIKFSAKYDRFLQFHNGYEWVDVPEVAFPEKSATITPTGEQ